MILIIEVTSSSCPQGAGADVYRNAVVANGGAITLCEAIQSTNNNDVIQFDPALGTGPIDLLLGLLQVSRDIDIVGPGAETLKRNEVITEYCYSVKQEEFYAYISGIETEEP